VAQNPPETSATSTSDDYDVVLLVEKALSNGDARQVRSLHEGLDQAVTYHVLLPVDDAQAQIQAALSTMAGHELVPGPSVVPPSVTDLEEAAQLEREVADQAKTDLQQTLEVLKAAGAAADGATVTGDPVDALKAKIAEVDGREAIVLTASHVIAEFFHVDWASQARRQIGVPVLHLLEHETFDEQAGGGEGASLI
jgi:hypothetical protein